MPQSLLRKKEEREREKKKHCCHNFSLHRGFSHENNKRKKKCPSYNYTYDR